MIPDNVIFRPPEAGVFESRTSNMKFQCNLPKLETSQVILKSHFLSQGNGGIELKFENQGIDVKVGGNQKYFTWARLDPEQKKSSCLQVEVHNGETPVHLIVANCEDKDEESFLLNSENFVSGEPNRELEPDAIRWDEWIQPNPSLAGKNWSFSASGQGVRFLGVSEAELVHGDHDHGNHDH